MAKSFLLVELWLPSQLFKLQLTHTTTASPFGGCLDKTDSLASVSNGNRDAPGLVSSKLSVKYVRLTLAYPVQQHQEFMRHVVSAVHCSLLRNHGTAVSSLFEIVSKTCPTRPKSDTKSRRMAVCRTVWLITLPGRSC